MSRKNVGELLIKPTILAADLVLQVQKRVQ
jgi:hypothetical protein